MSIGYDPGDFKSASNYDDKHHEWYPAKYGTYEEYEREMRREHEEIIQAQKFHEEMQIRNAQRLGITREDFEALDTDEREELLIRWNAKRLGFTDEEVDEMSYQRKRYLLP